MQDIEEIYVRAIPLKSVEAVEEITNFFMFVSALSEGGKNYPGFSPEGKNMQIFVWKRSRKKMVKKSFRWTGGNIRGKTVRGG